MTDVPTLQVSCGALCLDEQGRVLVLEPSYKKGWTLPGGMMEADGESPWDGCRRELREETGIEVDAGRLVVVDTRPSRKNGLGLRLLFHCGTLMPEQVAGIRLQKGEITRHRFVHRDEALELLRPAVARRVAVALDAEHCVYLEDGRPVDGVA